MAEKNIYTVGGTIQAGAGLYLERKADRELLELCRGGKFAYVLTAHQMGKSSLMAATARQLRAEGRAVVIIDLSQLGAHLAAEQWYLGLLMIVGDQLQIEIDLPDWWNRHGHLGYVHRMTLFFRNVILSQISAPVVIFIDEIDTTLSLPYADDFYVAIRYIYNARSEHAEFNRISFVLIGVATPADLISDPQRTPFNIGQRVDLSDFTFNEALPLTQGFDLSAGRAARVLRWVLKWTQGHPYLTQRLCQEIALQRRYDWTELEIDRLVAAIFFSETNARDMNLLFVEDMLTRRAPDKMKVLLTYRNIRSRRRPVKDEEQSLVKTHLKLAGIVKRKQKYLIVRNPIYRKAFDNRWLKEHLPINLVRLLSRTIIALIILLLCISLPLTWWALKSKAQTEALRFQANYILAKLFEEKAGSALNEAFMSNQTTDFQKAWLYTLEALHQDIGKDRWLPLSFGRLLSRKLQSAAFAELWRSAIFSPVPSSIAFSPDGQYIVSASGDNKIWLWEAESGEKLADFSGHQAAVLCVAFSPDGKLIASGSADNDIRVWDAKSGEKLLVLSGHSDDVWSVCFSPDNSLLVSGSGDNSLRLWNTNSGQQVAVFPNLAQDILSVAFSPNGQWIAFASRDDRVQLLDWKQKKIVRTFLGHTADVWSIGISPNNRQLVSGAGDRTVKLWDIPTGTLIQSLSGPKDDVLSVAFSPDGRRIAAASSDNTIWIWDVEQWKNLAVLVGHEAGVYSLAYSPDGKRIVTGAADNTIRLWDATSAEQLGVLSGHGNVVWGIAFSPDGQYLASAAGDTTVRLWDVRHQNLRRVLRGHSDYVWCVAFDPMGQILASGSADHTIRLWEVDSGNQVGVLVGHTGDVWSIAFSPDGRRLVSGSSDNSLRLWDVQAARQIAVLTGHSDDILSVAFSPDGKLIASGAWDNSIRLWQAENGREESVLKAHKVSVLTVAFSADSKWMASGAADNTIVIWDVQRRSEVKKLSGHTDEIWSVTFDPRGKYLASGSSDKTVRLWDVASGEQLAIFPEHHDVVWSVAFSPDGKLLASAAGDHTIRLHELHLLADNEFEQRKAELLTTIYDGSYFFLPFQREEQNLIPRKPIVREVEPVKRPGKSKFTGLHKPRPIEKSPVAWLLETMK